MINDSFHSLSMALIVDEDLSFLMLVCVVQCVCTHQCESKLVQTKETSICWIDLVIALYTTATIRRSVFQQKIQAEINDEVLTITSRSKEVNQ